MELNQTDIANYASDRYTASLKEIERIKNGIYHNRKGQVSLVDIQVPEEAHRLSKRIQREGVPLDLALERINGVPNFQDVFILRKIVNLADSVCRIIIKSPFGASGYGTGFLITPNLIITNNHVLPDAEIARKSLIQFRYELGATQASDPVTFALRPDIFYLTSPIQKKAEVPNSGLDFTIVAVADTSEDNIPLSSFTPARLDGATGKIIEGENCIVVQHPGGDYKKVVLKDIRMLTLTDNFLIYESDTLPGSSGGMVVGLGTGEIVALHHSGVPRRNNQGQWLRKNGTLVEPGDPDDVIDWLGNEGVRVSSIIQAVRNMELPKSMEKYRHQILESQPSAPTEVQSHSSTPTPTSMTTPLPEKELPGSLQQFEVELSAIEALQDDWKQNANTLVPELSRSEPIFPYASDADQRRFFYLSVKSDKTAWEMAAALEAMPHIDACTPDLPVYSDLATSSTNPSGMPQGQESILDFVYTDGSAKWNEHEFLEQWKNAQWAKEQIAANDLEGVRRWNWRAVNFNGIAQEDGRWSAVKKNIQNIKLVQLDTGYSTHSKVKESYDLQWDMDFVDHDSDARDEQAKWGFKMPSHGTRTASLVVGGRIKPEYEYDGNPGILHDTDKPLVKLIPYRVAKSVLLLGRAKDIVDAVTHAVNNGADVIFMCMGSYPRPMMGKVAQIAYESGVIWVCAAGNEVEVVVAPAIYPGTIAVAATNPDEKPWVGTSYGEAVDIAAPGESVYVPFLDKDGQEIMAYGDGTSYATPHVASAATLWKALHVEKLRALYPQKWQVVEAFRYCLRKSARKPASWKVKMYSMYGAGILDIEALLQVELPQPKELINAYQGKNVPAKADLGVREAIHFFWNTLKRKSMPGHHETMEFANLTGRGKTAYNALLKSQYNGMLESTASASSLKSKQILNDYFESFRR
ncbi:S8 family serine peptidase [Rufibacter latericius]|uniref:Serine protease n=1 Tax=Rufibacter latericius TaxID=2487040 RepID=A0A3M9MZW4_9BACT|nr:S8 family serine peptidase [Rufibacter latericius]RNI30685.1 hypothetical protein EFB08_05410 [Rufibacter latericius]